MENSQRGKQGVHYRAGADRDKRNLGAKRRERGHVFIAYLAVGAAEERETNGRKEEERGDYQQEMPVAEGDAAGVGGGRGLWVCTSSCEGGFM